MWFAFGLLAVLLITVTVIVSVWKRSKEAFTRRATAILVLVTASLIVGQMGDRYSAAHRILDHSVLFGTSAIFGLSMLVPFAFATVSLLGRRLRAWLAVIAAVLIGAPAFILCSHVLMREANIHLDFKTARIYEVHNVDTWISETYHERLLHVPDGPPDLPFSAITNLRLSAAEYAALKNKDRALLFVRPGALGYRWVERITPAPEIE